MRNVWMVTPVVALGLASCGDNGIQPPVAERGPFTLRLEATNYTAHAGKSLHAALVDKSDRSIVDKVKSITVPSDGAFSLEWVDLLQRNRSYALQYYVDSNDNGLCNSPGDRLDHSWSFDVSVSQSVVFKEKHAENIHDEVFTDVCATFGDHRLTFEGAGYGRHAGKTLAVAVLAGDLTMAAGPELITLPKDPGAAAFTFDWPRLLKQGQAYTIRFYGELNDTLGCQTDDHSWEVAVGTVTGDVKIRRDYSDPVPIPGTNVCASFAYDLTFAGTGYQSHMGKPLEIAVLRDGKVVARPAASQVPADGAISFQWSNLLIAGQPYKIHYYLDLNGMPGCQPGKSGDNGWEVNLGKAVAAIDRKKAYDAADPENVCSTFPYDFTFSGTGYTAHANKTIELAVVRIVGDNRTIVWAEEQTVPANGNVAFVRPALLKAKESYEIHYYAELDTNPGCHPEDSGWIVSIGQPTTHVAATRNHDGNFANVCGTFPYDLAFTGTGYLLQANQTLEAAVVQNDGTVEGVTIVTEKTAVGSGGSFAIEWSNLLVRNQGYKIRYYIEGNGMPGCQWPGDHAWEVDLGAATGDTAGNKNYNASDMTDVCSTFK